MSWFGPDICAYITRLRRLIGHSVKVVCPLSYHEKKTVIPAWQNCTDWRVLMYEAKQPESKLSNLETETESNMYLSNIIAFPRETCLCQLDKNQAVLSGPVVGFFLVFFWRYGISVGHWQSKPIILALFVGHGDCTGLDWLHWLESLKMMGRGPMSILPRKGWTCWFGKKRNKKKKRSRFPCESQNK